MPAGIDDSVKKILSASNQPNVKADSAEEDEFAKLRRLREQRPERLKARTKASEAPAQSAEASVVPPKKSDTKTPETVSSPDVSKESDRFKAVADRIRQRIELEKATNKAVEREHPAEGARQEQKTGMKAEAPQGVESLRPQREQTELVSQAPRDLVTTTVDHNAKIDRLKKDILRTYDGEKGMIDLVGKLEKISVDGLPLFDAETVKLMNKAASSEDVMSIVEYVLTTKVGKIVKNVGVAGTSAAVGGYLVGEAGAIAAVNATAAKLTELAAPHLQDIASFIQSKLASVESLRQTAGQMPIIGEWATRMVNQATEMMSRSQADIAGMVASKIQTIADVAGSLAWWPSAVAGGAAAMFVAGGIKGLIEENASRADVSRLDSMIEAAEEFSKKPRALEDGEADPRLIILETVKKIASSPDNLGFKFEKIGNQTISPGWLRFIHAAHEANVSLIRERTKMSGATSDRNKIEQRERAELVGSLIEGQKKLTSAELQTATYMLDSIHEETAVSRDLARLKVNDMFDEGLVAKVERTVGTFVSSGAEMTQLPKLFQAAKESGYGVVASLKLLINPASVVTWPPRMWGAVKRIWNK